MSHSSYTASERRGVLAIALVALLLIGVGVGMSMLEGTEEMEAEPMVTEHPGWMDTVSSDIGKSPDNGKDKKDKTSNSNKKTKTKKTYRRRNPLEEPV